MCLIMYCTFTRLIAKCHRQYFLWIEGSGSSDQSIYSSTMFYHRLKDELEHSAHWMVHAMALAC
jgi:hypothetical protein